MADMPLPLHLYLEPLVERVSLQHDPFAMAHLTHQERVDLLSYLLGGTTHPRHLRLRSLHAAAASGELLGYDAAS